MTCQMNVNIVKSIFIIFMTELQMKEENKELRNNNFFLIKHYPGMNN
jgi:hypothetical protein